MIFQVKTNIFVSIIIFQMFMPADNDGPNVSPGGLGKKILGDGLEIIEFPDMAHGWTVRGDLVIVIPGKFLRGGSKIQIQGAIVRK